MTSTAAAFAHEMFLPSSILRHSYGWLSVWQSCTGCRESRNHSNPWPNRLSPAPDAAGHSPLWRLPYACLLLWLICICSNLGRIWAHDATMLAALWITGLGPAPNHESYRISNQSSDSKLLSVVMNVPHASGLHRRLSLEAHFKQFSAIFSRCWIHYR